MYYISTKIIYGVFAYDGYGLGTWIGIAIIVGVACSLFMLYQIWKCVYQTNELLEQLVDERTN